MTPEQDAILALTREVTRLQTALADMTRERDEHRRARIAEDDGEHGAYGPCACQLDSDGKPHALCLHHERMQTALAAAEAERDEALAEVDTVLAFTERNAAIHQLRQKHQQAEARAAALEAVLREVLDLLDADPPCPHTAAGRIAAALHPPAERGA